MDGGPEDVHNPISERSGYERTPDVVLLVITSSSQRCGEHAHALSTTPQCTPHRPIEASWVHLVRDCTRAQHTT